MHDHGPYEGLLGGIASLVFAYALGRVGRFSPRATGALVALGAFVTMTPVPFFKYPANPPAVGDPETAARRTALYLLMVVLGVLLAAAAGIVGRRLAPKWGTWTAGWAAAGVFVVTIGLAYAFLPPIDEVPAGFPATLIWQFRLASLAIQAALWAVFGLVFGTLAERLLVPAAAGPESGREAVQPTS